MFATEGYEFNRANVLSRYCCLCARVNISHHTQRLSHYVSMYSCMLFLVQGAPV